MPSIRVVGSLNVDMVTVTPRVPGPGETLQATSFMTAAGGKGANQAVAAGRLSRARPAADSSKEEPPADSDIAVEMVGAAGQLDAYFPTILEPTLRGAGVHTGGVRSIADVYTGVAVITVDSSAGGENRILFTPGANFAGMQPEREVLETALAAAPAPPDVLVLQGEIPPATVAAVVRGAAAWQRQRHAVEVVLNPAPAPPGGLPADIYAAVGHLVMNETECELMGEAAGVPAEAGAPNSAAAAAEDVTSAGAMRRRERIAEHFHSLGVRTVVVTLGAAGLWYSAADGGSGGSHTTASRTTASVPAAPVSRVVDTTAAGDAWVGAYAVQVARLAAHRTQGGSHGPDAIAAAVRWATAAAARAVERPGAMDSIPWADEVDVK